MLWIKLSKIYRPHFQVFPNLVRSHFLNTRYVSDVLYIQRYKYLLSVVLLYLTNLRWYISRCTSLPWWMRQISHFTYRLQKKNKMTPRSNKQYLKFSPSGDPIKCKWRSIMIHDGNSENIKRLERKIDIYVFIKCPSFMATKTFAAYCIQFVEKCFCSYFVLYLETCMAILQIISFASLNILYDLVSRYSFANIFNKTFHCCSRSWY